MTEDDSDWSDYDSGPFCRHWSDPADCDRECTTCKHPCSEHYGHDDECRHQSGGMKCGCEEWTGEAP